MQLSYALSRLTLGDQPARLLSMHGYLLPRMPGALPTLFAGSIPCAAMVGGAFAATQFLGAPPLLVLVAVAVAGVLWPARSR